MSQLPDRLPGSPVHSREIARAAQAKVKAERAIYSHFLEMEYLRQCDAIDSTSIADVTRSALEEEMNVLDWGLERAAGSLAKAELVNRMVAQQSRIDIGRIARRFGE